MFTKRTSLDRADLPVRNNKAITPTSPESFRTRLAIAFPLFVLAVLIAGSLSLAFPLPAHGGDDGYRLLELDGYKVKWGDRQLGVGASISYAFARDSLRFDDARNCGDMESIEVLSGRNISMESLAHEAAAAFRAWEDAADLSFHEVGDARDADIVIGTQGRPRGRAFANVTYAADSEGGVRTIDQSLVCLNPDHGWKVGFDGDTDNYDIRYTLIHEIGHAIGLDHPGPSGQVMAFRYTEAFEDLQPGDVLGVRRLYGPANSNDTRLAEMPAEAHHDNDQIVQPVMSTTLGLGTSHRIETCQTQQDMRNPDPGLVLCGTTEQQ